MTKTLADFRPGASGSPATKAAAKRKTWVTPTRAEMPFGHLVCADQTLTAAGVVWLIHDERGLLVHRALRLRGGADEAATGWEKNLQQAESLRQQFRVAFDAASGWPWELVHEAPPSGGGKMRNPESSVLASAALRAAAIDAGVRVRPMIQPQSWKRLLFGPDHAGVDKPTINRLIVSLAIDLGIEGLSRITNEAHRDALGVGLGELLRSPL